MCDTLENSKDVVLEMFARCTISIWKNTRNPAEKVRTVGRHDHEQWVSFLPPSMSHIIHQSINRSIQETLFDHLASHKSRLYWNHSNCIKHVRKSWNQGALQRIWRMQQETHPCHHERLSWASGIPFNSPCIQKDIGYINDWFSRTSYARSTDNQPQRSNCRVSIDQCLEANLFILGDMKNMAMLCDTLLTRLWLNSYEGVRIITLNDPQTLLMSPHSTHPRFCKIITTMMAIHPCCPMDMEVVEVTNFLECRLTLKYSIWPPIPFQFQSICCDRNCRRSWYRSSGGIHSIIFSLTPSRNSEEVWRMAVNFEWLTTWLLLSRFIQPCFRFEDIASDLSYIGIYSQNETTIDGNSPCSSYKGTRSPHDWIVGWLISSSSGTKYLYICLKKPWKLFEPQEFRVE